MLTHQDLQALQRPFALDDHEFINGFVYIREDAITARIEQIDPAWTMTQDSHVIVDGQYNVSMDLTIKGVTRVGVGTAQAIFKSDKLVNEPLKSAATDALKRAARLFGIGRYLLQAPKERDFARWLASLSGGAPVHQPTPNQSRRIPQQAQNAPEAPKSSANGRIDVLLTSAIKETRQGAKVEIQKYKFKVQGQKSDGYDVSCFCWQFAEWSGLKSLKDASAYDESTGVYTMIEPIKAQIEQVGQWWNVVSVERLATS